MAITSLTPGSTSTGVTGSVGHKGLNKKSDVLTVQKLLNQAGAELKPDGSCGPATINAIEGYQRNWSKHPDGRVDPGGHTWKKLVEGKLKLKKDSYVMLPQACGYGYYSYSSMDRQFGTSATIHSLIQVCMDFTAKYPDLQVGIGDMSFADGRHMSPHKTHTNGRNADIRPFRTDGKMTHVTITDKEYSHEYTKAFVEMLRKNSNLKSILFNDTKISGVSQHEGHDNHLHVSMKE
ncbi:MAG TPA: peptidoglycan-binding domain-containing protein [Silvibacterium sp.]|nr:peptidoglycan-binding domain-containing protein [Silvibacterium sp.]